MLTARPNHHAEELIALFDITFYQTFNTRLVRGDGEPVYVPAGDTELGQAETWHQVVFAHGFFASAMHEIAHWCIAGTQRRQLLDYGYWYCPDGRDEQQQADFEKVEVKPQALEWCFCVASGYPFKVSTDNLNGAPVDRFAFQDKVYSQVAKYLEVGLPARAQVWVQQLQQHYKMPPLEFDAFQKEPGLELAC